MKPTVTCPRCRGNGKVTVKRFRTVKVKKCPQCKGKRVVPGVSLKGRHGGADPASHEIPDD